MRASAGRQCCGAPRSTISLEPAALSAAPRSRRLACRNRRRGWASSCRSIRASSSTNTGASASARRHASASAVLSAIRRSLLNQWMTRMLETLGSGAFFVTRSGSETWRGCASDRQGMHGASFRRKPPGGVVPVAASDLSSGSPASKTGSTARIDAARGVQDGGGDRGGVGVRGRDRDPGAAEHRDLTLAVLRIRRRCRIRTRRPRDPGCRGSHPASRRRSAVRGPGVPRARAPRRAAPPRTCRSARASRSPSVRRAGSIIGCGRPTVYSSAPKSITVCGAFEPGGTGDGAPGVASSPPRAGDPAPGAASGAPGAGDPAPRVASSPRGAGDPAPGAPSPRRRAGAVVSAATSSPAAASTACASVASVPPQKSPRSARRPGASRCASRLATATASYLGAIEHPVARSTASFSVGTRTSPGGGASGPPAPNTTAVHGLPAAASRSKTRRAVRGPGGLETRIR